MLVLASTTTIYFGYRYYEFKWPERYFGPHDKDSIFISTNPFYYFFFRVLPVVIVIFTILGTFQKASVSLLNPVLLGLLIGTIYAVQNDGRVIIDLLTQSKEVKRYENVASQYIVHISIILMLTGAGIIAGYLSTISQLYFVLPNINGLVDNIWATFLTVLMVFILYKLSKKPKETDMDQIIAKALGRIKKNVFFEIEQISEKHNADPILVKAVCIAEDIERPGWIRHIENLFGYIFRKQGSYGIMQIQTKKPINDIESIKQSVPLFFSNAKKLSIEAKKKVVEKYNRDDNFVYLVEEIYRYITPSI